ncbi:hypothetical protein ACFL6R_06340 [Gemmatimonadota bacterium]
MDLDERVDFMALFPDGQRIAFSDLSRGDVGLLDLTSGEISHLTQVKGFLTAEYGGFPLINSVSPDGRYVVTCWESPEDFSWELRKIAVEDGTTTVIHDSEISGYLQPYCWSRDGTKIALTIAPGDERTQIAVIPANGGTVAVLKELSRRTPDHMAFSPDGRFLAYDLVQEEGSLNSDIFILATDGSSEIRAVDHSAHDYLLEWWPEKDLLLFISNRTGSLAVWAQHMNSGRPVGEPMLIRPGIGRIGPVGLSQDGRLFYRVSFQEYDLLIAELNIQTGTLSGPAARVSPDFMGGDNPAWSRNGRYLVYQAPTQVREPSGGGMSPISILDTETGQTKQITPKLSVGGIPAVSSDGRRLVIRGRDFEGIEGIYAIEISNGEAVWLASCDPEKGLIAIGTLQWSQDDRYVYYHIIGRGDPSLFRIMRVEIASGRVDEILQSYDRISRMILSPDDSWIAFSFMEREEWENYQNRPQNENAEMPGSSLAVIPSTGGSVRVIGSLPESFLIHMAWSPDGREIRVPISIRERTMTEEGLSSNLIRREIWRVPADGGDPVIVEEKIPDCSYYIFHPDGRQIAFQRRPEIKPIELWVMENFLPPAQQLNRPRRP